MKKKLRALSAQIRKLSAQGRLEPDQQTAILRAFERAEKAARNGDRKLMQKSLGEIAMAFCRLPFEEVR